MKPRLLDILACPMDRHFPLELRIETIGEVKAAGSPCATYCARHDGLVEESPVPLEDCNDCRTSDIKEGEIYCPVCRTNYRISDGIPNLMMADSVGDHISGQDKANEMKARDEQADAYDDLRMLAWLSRLEVPKLMELLDPQADDLVVELGAGTGRITNVIARSVSELVAVDFSIESLKRSRFKCDTDNVHWIHADINHLPLRDLVADKAFSCQVLEHLPGTALRNKAIDEAARIIKGPGPFVVSVYRDSLLMRLFGPKEGYHVGGIYYFRLNIEEFRDLITRQFVIEKIVPNVGIYLQMAKCVKEPD